MAAMPCPGPGIEGEAYLILEKCVPTCTLGNFLCEGRFFREGNFRSTRATHIAPRDISNTSPPLQNSPLPSCINMSTISRTLRYLKRIGFKQYAYQMNRIGDTKYGALVGTDKYGNKYYENNTEELPLRTKWVDYKEWKEYDASMVEPGWHGWLAYMFDKPPTSEPIMKHDVRPWEPKEHIPNQTFSRAAYKPYSTTKPKISWYWGYIEFHIMLELL
ncbi:uncharacterized protein H6S33_012468 [Morchella sextelata]|uniref:uncharacterized protein n=1 Tax=Morchella sextelata TaxID=1174677 RepID=UPI001D03B9FF|nr:uncharacterized protein H6S33_012468 [Morchella sextelata]KAH0609922.1 hypothetical protein H6S33_012468 [Morchella sextelata]